MYTIQLPQSETHIFFSFCLCFQPLPLLLTFHTKGLWARADLHSEADLLPAQVSAPCLGACLLLPGPALTPLPPTCP